MVNNREHKITLTLIAFFYFVLHLYDYMYSKSPHVTLKVTDNELPSTVDSLNWCEFVYVSAFLNRK